MCPHAFPIYPQKHWKLYEDYEPGVPVGLAPCGKCPNCIADLRNRYETEATYELSKHHNLASYVTFTYDKYHCPYVELSDGSIGMTIKYEDVKKFKKRLRMYMKRRRIDMIGMSPNFSFLSCCEYGEDGESLGLKGRPHWHCIFFGLDYRLCEKMFRECWNFGEIKVLPYRQGAVTYVTSYITKQIRSVFGKAKDLYECRGRRRPKVTHSPNFGLGFYLDNWKYIETHNYCYKSKHGKDVPIPAHIRRRFHVWRETSLLDDQKEFIQKYSQKYGKAPSFVVDFAHINKFKQMFAEEREQNLIARLTRMGQPVPRYEFYHKRDRSPMKYAIADVKGILSHGGYGTYMKCLQKANAEKFIDFRDLPKMACKEYVSAMKQYWTSTFSLHHDGWCYEGQSELFPGYKSFPQVITAVERYGDVVPF